MEGGLRQLSAFMQVSLDGRFADAAAEISFAHQQAADAEWHQFMAENAAWLLEQAQISETCAPPRP
jgi:hypothetical protein